MIAGFVLGLKDTGTLCLLDGFPVTAGAFLAFREDPSVATHLIAGHRSKVRGHSVMLDAMGLEPLVDLGLRLGEGTGAVLGGIMVDAACRFCGEALFPRRSSSSSGVGD